MKRKHGNTKPSRKHFLASALAILTLLTMVTVTAYAEPPEGLRRQGRVGRGGQNQGMQMSQPRGNRGQRGIGQALRQHLYKPNTVKRFAQEINLSQEQQDKIIKELNSFQNQNTAQEWKMHGGLTQLNNLLSQSKVDEKKVVSQARAVIENEKAVKLGQLQLLIRIKNILTPEQQTKLNELRSQNSKRNGRNSRNGRQGRKNRQK